MLNNYMLDKVLDNIKEIMANNYDDIDICH